MTRIFTVLVAITVVTSLSAQSDILNAQKYWKFRNSFRQDFIKIGMERGESIPCATRRPTKCPNNIEGDSGAKGTMRWGDGMILQGHYIGFLATEYRLLKDNGGDYWPALNELYYALQAINRVDEKAEEVITEIEDNGLPHKEGRLDGFYLRDDVPGNFYEHWETAEVKCRCIESDIYHSNNAANENSEFHGWVAKNQTDDHSIPSLDQMTSLLLGLTVCHKLIEDGVYVQPTPEDEVKDIKTEVKAITNRIINYAYNHNWFLLDEWGWPVGNGGGELAFTAYPITVIGNKITGNDYSSTIKRRGVRYDFAKTYFSEPSTSKRDEMWDTLTPVERDLIEIYALPDEWHEEPLGLSRFEKFQSAPGPGYISFSTDLLEGWWTDINPYAYAAHVIDWEEDYKFDLLPFPLSAIPFRSLQFTDYNTNIQFNLGVASGTWNSAQVYLWTAISDNYQLPLIDALLKDTEPAIMTREFFRSYLNSMPIYGGFKFEAEAYPYGPKQRTWSPGWGGEYKWYDPEESDDWIGHPGQFNALDYLYLHNLYTLVYGDEIENDFEESYDCLCDSETFEEIEALGVTDDPTPYAWNLPTAIELELPIIENLKEQLEYLDFCTPNSFEDFPTKELETSFDLKQLFDDYHDIGILLNEFQTDEFTIKDNGELNIESRFIICNTKELSVENGGVVNLDKGEIIIKPGASLIVQGEVNLENDTRIIVEPEGKIVIKNGGVLDNQGYIQLKEGATLEYEEGATVNMTSDESEIHFDGGDLILRENADFTFGISGESSGQLRFSRSGDHIFAEPNTSILIGGIDMDDPIIVLEKNADFFCDTEDLKWINLHDGKVILNENSRFVGIQDFSANEIHFESLDTNRGLVTFDQTDIIKSKFDNVHIEALLFYKNAGDFNMTQSEINHSTEDFMIYVQGMGYTISESDFNGQAQYMLKAKNTTEYSLLSQCVFEGDMTTTGVIDNSFSELTVQGCAFNNLYAGVHKPDGKVNLKCNSFNDIHFSGAIAQNNCILDMSSKGLGGYNTFDMYDGLIGSNITLWNAQNILLNKGYNTFDDIGELPIITGSVQYAVPPPLASTVFARANKWNPANSIPPTTDFEVISSITDIPIDFYTDSPEYNDCPISDELDSDVGSYSPLQGVDSILVNTAHFHNIPLSQALDQCNEASKRYDEGNNNLLALELFEEVLLTFPDMPASIEADWLVRLGTQQMKQVLRQSFYNGEITKEDNVISFHQGVQRYVNVLNAVTSIPLTQHNYQQMFYWEMDKAQLMHSLGKHTLALGVILNAESCRLDSLEQVYVNHWKFELDEEFKKRAFGLEAAFKDTNWVDTSYYNLPVSQDFGYFNSEIIDPNNVEFYSCGLPRSYQPFNEESETQAENDNFNFSVYPNPNNGVFNVTYNLPDDSSGVVVIYNSEGKAVYHFTCQTGNHREVVNLQNLGQGTYFYSNIVNEVKTNSGRFVIQ